MKPKFWRWKVATKRGKLFLGVGLLMIPLVFLQVLQFQKFLAMQTPSKTDLFSTDNTTSCHPIQPPGTKAGFSACLLWKDDNHYLIEWLAYHYHTLPLRRLIVATDPSSVSSPIPNLERYNHLIDWEVWSNESAYIPNVEQKRQEIWKQIQSDKFFQERGMSEYEVWILTNRQRHFYCQCMNHLKQEGYTWTLFIDTDEYLLPNAHASTKVKRIYDVRPSSTILSTLQLAYHNFTNCGYSSYGSALSKQLQRNPCVQMPRLLIGTHQDEYQDSGEVYPALGKDFDASRDLMTLRYQWHGGFGFVPNGHMKGMVDVSRLDDNFQCNPDEPTMMHYPIPQCLKYFKQKIAATSFVSYLGCRV